MFAIGVDIGGTKVISGLVEVGADGAILRVAFTDLRSTPRVAPPAFYDTIAEMIHRTKRFADAGKVSVAPCIGVAHPGRFLPDGSLARGTTPNMGERPGQFDGLRPAGELKRRVGGDVVAENDAIAQMRYGLDVLLRDAAARSRLLGRTVVYLGPGTGMGGGVARVSAQGEMGVITDGHFFDLAVPGYGDGTVAAEELLTGPAIGRLVAEANRTRSSPIDPPTSEQLDHLLTDPGASASQRTAAEQVADQVAEVLARIVETIHAGVITKVRLDHRPDGAIMRSVDEPDRAWSEVDRAAVRGTDRFILGGSVGISAGLGGRIRTRALEGLAQRGLGQIELLQIPVTSADAGLLGAILAAQQAMVMSRGGLRRAVAPQRPRGR